MGCLLAVFAADPSVWAFDVTTHHYDNLRTGWNPYEKILTPSNVGSPSFGLIATATVDEQVDAQPLVLVNAKGRAIVYVATENNTIYAIDGDTGAILKSRHLAAPVPYSTYSYCSFNSNVIGIGATPVIALHWGRKVLGGEAVLFVLANTLEGTVPSFKLYALDLEYLADAVPPVTVTASQTLSDGTTYQFNPSVSRSRSALLLSNDNVYAGFGSYCDFYANESRGWLLGWDARTLAPLPNDWLTNSEATSPDNFFLTAIWMSGNGVASDGNDLYFVTSNSDPSGKSWNASGNLTESVVKLSTNLATLDGYFTPYTYPSLDKIDEDFGSGGIMLLPPQSGSIPSLATALGKDGNLYLLNRAALGGYNPSTNAVLGTYNGGMCWCGESYFTGQDGINRVVSSGGSGTYGQGLLQTWQVQTSPSVKLVADSWSQKIDSGQEPGFFTSVSSNGKTNAVIWALGRPNGTNNNAVYLNAFDANTGHPLVKNMIAGYWPFVSGDANLVPVVTNGKVYVGSYKQLAIFGLGASGMHATVQPVGAPQLELPPQVQRVTGVVKSVFWPKVVLTTRFGTEATVDGEDAARSAHIPVSGNTLTVVGQYHADGTLFAQSISRAKSDPALWPPDR